MVVPKVLVTIPSASSGGSSKASAILPMGGMMDGFDAQFLFPILHWVLLFPLVILLSKANSSYEFDYAKSQVLPFDVPLQDVYTVLQDETTSSTPS
uniref:Uncharacterized protein n=1 Tax=Cannabis sativa TaxID=3483 RepID=A0A803P2I7_CANSA